MQSNRKAFIVPMLVITVGAGWLLTSLGVVPGIDWVWTLGLAVVGFVAFALSGIDKVSVVVGPFFLAAGLMSVVRQTGRMRLDVEVPILVIVAGVLLLVATLPSIPVPEWARKAPPLESWRKEK